MPSARPSSLRAFLSTARRTLAQHLQSPQRSQRLNLVVGNESADLDSITSAIAYAYFRTYSDPRHPSHPTTSVHVPILNIPREDVRIRRELLKLLPHAGIGVECLITLSEVFPTASSLDSAASRHQLDPSTVELTLVDHNSPTGPLDHFRSSITACIDHHVDESAVPTTVNPRIITLDAGSCTSLVVQHVRPSWDALTTSASNFGAANSQEETVSAVQDEAMRRGWDVQLAKLALASVLIDTMNLEDENKTREADKEAVAYLTAKIDLAPLGKTGGVFDRKKFFEEIKEAKGDLSGLSVGDVLKKDYKEFEVGEKRLGMSSVVKPLQWISDKADKQTERGDSALGEIVEGFVKGKKLDVFAIMTAAVHEPGDEFQRELVVWSDPSDAKALPKDWYADLEQELKVESISTFDDANPNLRILRQWDVSKSRKQVAPLLREMMEQASKS